MVLNDEYWIWMVALEFLKACLQGSYEDQVMLPDCYRANEKFKCIF